MKFNNILILTLVLLFAMMPGLARAQENSTGTENFIFVNYIGQELILDLDDTLYVIPGTDTQPEGGQLALNLPYGEHKYAANVPGIEGSAGTFNLQAGVTVAKGARIEQTSPKVKDGVLIEKPRDYVFLFDFDPNASESEPAPVEDTWLPSAPPPGQGSLVWINYIGDELTVDLNGQLYRVNPDSGTIPGRLQVDVSPGKYTYTASVPGGSINSEVSLTGGQVLGVNILADLPEPPVYDVGDEFDLTPALNLRQFVEDLTMKATVPDDQATVTDEVPQEMPPADESLEPVVTGPIDDAGQEGLAVNNFAGEALVLTIDNQAYIIPPDESRTISLPSGSYTYTVSTPFAAANGIVNLSTATDLELSVVTNLSHDFLTVYQN